MVIGNDRMRKRKPFIAALGHAIGLGDFDDRCAHVFDLLSKMLAVEGEHLAPAVHALLGPVQRPVPIEEAVAGAVIAVELMVLAVLLQLGLMLIDLLGARRAVVIAEQAE